MPGPEIYTLTPELGRALQEIVRQWRAERNRFRLGGQPFGPPPQPVPDDGLPWQNGTGRQIAAHEVISLASPIEDETWGREWKGSGYGDEIVVATAPAWIQSGRTLALNGPEAVAPGDIGRCFQALGRPAWAKYRTAEDHETPPRIGELWGPGDGYGADAAALVFGFPGFRIVGPTLENKNLVRVVNEAYGPWWAEAQQNWTARVDDDGLEWRWVLCRLSLTADGQQTRDLGGELWVWLPPGCVAFEGDVFSWTFGYVPEDADPHAKNGLTPIALGARPCSLYRARLTSAAQGTARLEGWEGAELEIGAYDYGRLPAGAEYADDQLIYVTPTGTSEEIDGQRRPVYEIVSAGLITEEDQRRLITDIRIVEGPGENDDKLILTTLPDYREYRYGGDPDEEEVEFPVCQCGQ